MGAGAGAGTGEKPNTTMPAAPKRKGVKKSRTGTDQTPLQSQQIHKLSQQAAGKPKPQAQLSEEPKNKKEPKRREESKKKMEDDLAGSVEDENRFGASLEMEGAIISDEILEKGGFLLEKLLFLLALGFQHLCQFRCRDAISTFQSLPLSHYETGWVLSQIGRAHLELIQYQQVLSFLVLLLSFFPFLLLLPLLFSPSSPSTVFSFSSLYSFFSLFSFPPLLLLLPSSSPFSLSPLLLSLPVLLPLLSFLPLVSLSCFSFPMIESRTIPSLPFPFYFSSLDIVTISYSLRTVSTSAIPQPPSSLFSFAHFFTFIPALLLVLSFSPFYFGQTGLVREGRSSATSTLISKNLLSERGKKKKEILTL